MGSFLRAVRSERHSEPERKPSPRDQADTEATVRHALPALTSETAADESAEPCTRQAAQGSQTKTLA